MSILDDAIREHLELKRSHGADEGELKRLEDEAFGPPQRPDEVDPFAEAPTEFLTSPGETAAEEPAIGDEGERGGRRPNITDLQEAPAESGFFDREAEPPAPMDAAPPAPTDAEAPAPMDAEAPAPMDAAPPEPPVDELSPAPDAPPPSPTDAVDAPPPPPAGEAAADLAPPTAEPPAPEPPAPAAAEEDPAGEQEIVPDHGPDTEERHLIADQPTQMFDVQAHVDAEAAAAESHEKASPTDEELVDAAQEEPHAAPPAPEQPPLESRGPDAEVAGHPPAEAEPEEESTEYDFFNEQRLSDELDQALEAPTQGERDLPRYEDAESGAGGIFDFDSHGGYEEDPSEEVLHRHDAREAESEEAPGVAEPPSEEAPFEQTVEQPRPSFEPPAEEAPEAGAEQSAAEEDDYDFDPETGHEDVLEDKPRFLEDQEDDDLWFEQKPPKDFDLD
ncbi:MAG: hypothetical protein QM729_20700 [Solirubrobacterales bacterium]